VVVRPVSAGSAAGLAYRQWVDDRRALVERMSGGTLGYVHLADMSSESLDQLYLDLDAENQGKQGVVVDIRNNNGGFINGYA
ncbi:S41 family peptidase, partial [Pseudomonas sp. GP01-A5]